MTEGRCLCGAVEVTAVDLGNEISACHCTYCTRYGGGVQMGIEARVENVTITGPVKVHRSTEIAERAWCDTCGSPIWLKNVAGEWADVYELSPGLFDNAGGARLTRVVYADRHPDGFWMEGPDVTRVSQRDYEAQFPHIPEDAP